MGSLSGLATSRLRIWACPNLPQKAPLKATPEGVDVNSACLHGELSEMAIQALVESCTSAAFIFSDKTSELESEFLGNTY